MKRKEAYDTMSNDISEFSRRFWEAKYSAWRKEHPGESVVPEMTMRLWHRELKREVKEMKKAERRIGQ